MARGNGGRGESVGEVSAGWAVVGWLEHRIGGAGGMVTVTYGLAMAVRRCVLDNAAGCCTEWEEGM